MSKLDWFWRRLIVTKLYTQGWGKPDDMKRYMKFALIKIYIFIKIKLN